MNHAPAAHRHRYAGLLSILLVTVGCAAIEPQMTPINREVLRQPAMVAPQPSPRYEGSLFDGGSGRSLLFADRKARHLNDIVTIRITESATASGEASTGTERASSISGSLESVFGLERTLKNNGLTPASAVKAGLSNGFDGSGATARKNSLSATITAVVREIFPNGNLYIEGSKEVMINNERQFIILTGVIRPEDINPDNSISSNLIADARIAYSGRGVVSDKQRPGWLGRTLDLLWPF